MESAFDKTVTAKDGGKTNFADEKHAEYVVRFDHVRDAWARNISARYMAHGIAEMGHDARSITVQDCQTFDPVSDYYGRATLSLQCQWAIMLGAAVLCPRRPARFCRRGRAGLRPERVFGLPFGSQSRNQRTASALVSRRLVRQRAGRNRFSRPAMDGIGTRLGGRELCRVELCGKFGLSKTADRAKLRHRLHGQARQGGVCSRGRLVGIRRSRRFPAQFVFAATQRPLRREGCGEHARRAGKCFALNPAAIPLIVLTTAFLFWWCKF